MNMRQVVVPIVSYILLAIPALLQAQAEIVRESLFPAELEFAEIQHVQSRQAFTGAVPAGILKEKRLFDEASLKKYEKRIYGLAGGGNLTIEITNLNDKRGAFSLFTLLRKSALAEGPPGDYFSTAADSIIFSQEAFFVRIQSDATGDLIKRVARSVSNRIGPRNAALPSLIAHLPKQGMDSGSIRYFLGEESFKNSGYKFGRGFFQFHPEMELAQAQYSFRGETGTLSIISFPTGQLAEQYFDDASEKSMDPADGATRSFAKRAGPLVAILEGNFTPAGADALLGDVKFTYSIKWIYDKNNKSSQTLWGVPVAILGTVVRSLALTALLCIFSVLAGVGIALFRVGLRGYAPNNFLDRPERTEMIRLKINEN